METWIGPTGVTDPTIKRFPDGQWSHTDLQNVTGSICRENPPQDPASRRRRTESLLKRGSAREGRPFFPHGGDLDGANMTHRLAAIQTTGWFWLAIAIWIAPCSRAQTAPPVEPDPGWPRVYTDGAAKLTIYQPQVDSWKDFANATARFALALTPGKGAQPVWGTLCIETRTLVNQK